MSRILASPPIEKRTKIITGDICSLWLAASLHKNVCLTTHIPFTETICNTDLSPCLSGAVFQGYWKCYLPSKT